MARITSHTRITSHISKHILLVTQSTRSPAFLARITVYFRLHLYTKVQEDEISSFLVCSRAGGGLSQILNQGPVATMVKH